MDDAQTQRHSRACPEASTSLWCGLVGAALLVPMIIVGAPCSPSPERSHGPVILLVLAKIGSLLLVTAVIAGFIALAKIRRSAGSLTGLQRAAGGLLLGCFIALSPWVMEPDYYYFFDAQVLCCV